MSINIYSKIEYNIIKFNKGDDNYEKRLQGLIAGLLIGAIVTGGAALAIGSTTLYDVITDGINIVVDGKKLNPTDVNGNAVQPMIYNGTTYLPVRAVADAGFYQ